MFGVGIYSTVIGGLLAALWKHPGVALAGVLCMFGLEQWGQATTTYFVEHQTATNYLIGGILVLALTAQGLKRGFTLLSGYPAVGWLTLAFFLYAFASTQWAARSDISMELWVARWPYVLTCLVLSPLIFAESRDLRSAFTGLFLAGGALTLVLLLFVKWEARRIVLDHDLGNPLAAAAMAGMVALIAILADPWPRSKWLFPVRGIVVVLCLALVVRSGSRGQLLGILLVCIVCWPISRGISNVKQLLLLGIAIVLLGSASMWALQEFWTQQPDSGHVSRWSEQSAREGISGRLNNALLLLRLAYHSPETVLLGLGNSSSYDPRILGIYPHFVPLEVLAEEGLVGGGLYVAILYCSFRSVRHCLRLVAAQPRERVVLGGLVSLYLFALLLSLKQGSLLLNLEPFMLGIILGRYEQLLLWHHADRQQEEEQRVVDQPIVFSLPAAKVWKAS